MSPGVYAFIGYSTSNFGVIAGNSGYILIDAGDNITGAEEALDLIKNLAPLGLKAVIPTLGTRTTAPEPRPFWRGSLKTSPFGGITISVPRKTCAPYLVFCR